MAKAPNHRRRASGVRAELAGRCTASAEASELALTIATGAADAVVAANKSMRTLAVETARTLPRLVRLGQINDHTRISLGRIIDEQADARTRRRVPAVRRPGAHLRGGQPAHRQRRARADRGRRAPGHPGRRADGHPAQRAGRHRRAVAARRGRGAHAAGRRSGAGGPARRGHRAHHRPGEPCRSRHAAACRYWSSAAARTATWTCPPAAPSSTWSRSTPTPSNCRGGTGRTRATPATSRSWSSTRSAAGSWCPSRSPTTGGRCRRSAPASAAALNRNDTVYCLTPLHHQSGLLVSLGGAVVGRHRGSRCRAGCTRSGSSTRSASTASPS